ncbi:hypothetical protein CLIB1423_04S02674 [[Candida] railenensis]|uniref:FAD-binding FR-type domain-containing protein n=1 Tax=[Candida] railenensis TaxID=45579 RepID=A0A9P0QMV1_9ASCO|nr:hypothetical protein CLIB1423_04S02674 [[Candida] railenensis]
MSRIRLYSSIWSLKPKPCFGRSVGLQRCTPASYRFYRFNSSGKDKKEGADQHKQESGGSSSSVPDTKKEPSNSISQYNVKQVTSPGAHAPIDSSKLEPLLRKDNKPYLPKVSHKRVTYEYPGLPNQDEFQKYNDPQKTTYSRWRRHIPKIAIFVVVAWAAYSVKVWVYEPETGAASNDILSPEEFHPFIITHKEQIDDQHYLIEIKPKYDQWEYSYANSYQTKSIWNGAKHIWSVEVMHPQIMVVRSYTPLPLYFLKSEQTRAGDKKPLLKVINNDEEDCDKHGTMVLYIKRYEDGEVSKFITNKKIGDEIQLRGPNIEYKFPYHPVRESAVEERPIFRDLPSTMEMDKSRERPSSCADIPPVDNLTFYAAGTGVAPILQALMSRKPYEGYVKIHYSAQKPGEIRLLERFIFFLEKLDRVNFTFHYDTVPKSRLGIKDVNPPAAPNYVSELRKSQVEKNVEKSPEELLKLRMSILEGDHEKSGKLVEEKEYPRYSNALEQAIQTSKEEKKDAALAIVCGPQGYIEYVAGVKNEVDQEQGPVEGLLGKKGWNSTNVYKL